MRPKIALVIPGFQSSPEDWCIPVFTNLARVLSEQVELHVFALRYPARHDTYQIGGVRVHAFGAGRIGARRLPVASLLRLWRAFLSGIEHEHRRTPFALVLGVWATESGWLATRAAKRLGVAALVHIAGGELTSIGAIGYGNWHRGLAGRLVEDTLRHADLLTVPSGPLHRSLPAWISQNRVRQWAPGVNTAMFVPRTPEPVGRRPFIFCTAGSLIPVKGQALIIRALAEVRTRQSGRNIRLRVVGSGPLRGALEGLTTELQLTGYVSFEGDVPHDLLPGVYASSDAFVLGSWHEAQCMAALEAMACGLPWVAPPVGALADIAAAGHAMISGTLFTDRDPVDVADAMQTVVELTPAEHVLWGQNARHLIEQRYALQPQAEALLEIIARLTQS